MSWRDEVNTAVEGETAGRSGYTRVNCPACDDRVGKRDRKSSVSVNLRDGWWRCWRCDWRGRLNGYDDDDIEDDEGWEDVEEVEIERPSEYWELSKPSYFLEAPRKYLRSRDVHENLWTQARLGYAMRGKHSGRIIMPIWGDDGHWLGWVGRHIGKSTIPYWTAKGMDRRSLFYNNIALGRTTEVPLVVTEGPFDALRHWPDAVAALGKPTEDHIAVLRQCKRPIVIALDGDAWSEGLGVAQILRTFGRKAYALALPPVEDLDSTDPNLVRYGIRYTMENETDADLRG